jgi:nitroimidazol reductase NimA-like FMN-containing flavoprotein (pyridoxamine 5'-phosphate oxidase superfamily)
MLDQMSGVEIIERDECLALLRSASVGRLGFILGDAPEILPVNYGLDGEAVVFVTNAGSKLWGTARSPVVFEVDHVDEEAKSGWSVIVRGVAQEVLPTDSPALLARIRGVQPTPWAGGDRTHVIRISAHQVTGRRVGAPQPEAR